MVSVFIDDLHDDFEQIRDSVETMINFAYYPVEAGCCGIKRKRDPKILSQIHQGFLTHSIASSQSTVKRCGVRLGRRLRTVLQCS